jgi:lactoylglutathione lyase
MPTIEFAKPAFDVGFATNDIDGYSLFWGGRVGLPYDHMAKLGGGFHQHRWTLGDSIIKVNHTRTSLPEPPAGGYSGLTVGHTENAALTTPDDIPVMLAPSASADLVLHAKTADLDAFMRFYSEALGLTRDGLDALTLGRSRIIAEPGKAERVDGWRERGLRYLTVQIFDCDGITAALERAGIEIGMAPTTVGQVRYSFVRDPDGNWIELSERASLTGKPVPAG